MKRRICDIQTAIPVFIPLLIIYIFVIFTFGQLENINVEVIKTLHTVQNTGHKEQILHETKTYKPTETTADNSPRKCTIEPTELE